ncbi:uncharacterized protein A4U43_C03F24720 [Asparagus officinalis]|uniref:Pentacotripeptide-repeat region of PRORP domain-containing protein n=1 Tax=Asparagus officinalis TaxID=4686 RepID=A0A5P1FCQ0_ASPOF|nr:pentatricopeptide repeat-containing protein At5g67570, chloroplastic [Asparagus officinalis]ONK76175.1 uncharacterized protein A4U43_C03F24720 [Asparagus officinalis]
MDLSLRSPVLLPISKSKPSTTKPRKPNTDLLKQELLQKGVTPTPKILHAVRKKQTLKFLRKSKKRSQSQPQLSPLSNDDESFLFDTIKAEYRAVVEHVELKGRPWERSRKVDLRGVERGRLISGGKLRGEHLDELREVLAERNGANLRWVLDADVEEVGESLENGVRLRENISEDEKIRLLVKRLTCANLSTQDWKFSRVMKQSCIIFSEMHVLKIVERLGILGNWRLAMSVVEWVYDQKDYKHLRSRFVYTKLISVLGKARRPIEACQVFNLMRDDGKLYPDMAAYHAIAVTLGQAGLVNELISIVESMKQKPSKRIKNIKYKNWNPCLEPDIVIFNAVLNACVPSHQWKGVSWVLHKMRLSGLKPTETTYGLAMEVMLKAGKYGRIHKYFETMRRGGLATKALTYKVLVRTFWEEGKVDEAVEAVRDMERRGVVGTANVYYELACCLCHKGRWRDAMVEIEKLKRFSHAKPLEVTFTGLILSSLNGGYPSDCISIFEYMKNHCVPNVGTINAMLKMYGCSDNFAKAKELFESIKNNSNDFSAYIDDGTLLKPDAYSYTSMLEASAAAHQWEYFEHVYKEMALCGFQLDQNKHVRLLVAASRAGKGHLLEHAFDSILEAEEVPHRSLFIELVYQTISQENFERTVALINGMAHASMCVCESQWSNIFSWNKDHLCMEKLLKLLNHLGNSDNLVMEDPVPNFIRSLESYVQIPSSNALLLAASREDSENESIFGNRERIQGHLRCSTLIHSDGESESRGNDITSIASNCNGNFSIRHDTDVNLLEGVDFDVFSSSSIGNEGKWSESTQKGHSDSPNGESCFDLLTDNIDDSFSKLPSASDILETWKKDRIKDGIFPFEYMSSNIQWRTYDEECHS